MGRILFALLLLSPFAVLISAFFWAYDSQKSFLDNVPNLDSLSSIAAAVIAAVGFPIIYRQLRLQSEANEIQTISQIQIQIEQGWEKIRFVENNDEYKIGYHFGQLCNTLEFACYIWNHVNLEKRAKKIIADFICQNLIIIEKDTDYVGRIEKMIGGPDDLIEIANFIKKNRKRFSALSEFHSLQNDQPNI